MRIDFTDWIEQLQLGALQAPPRLLSQGLFSRVFSISADKDYALKLLGPVFSRPKATYAWAEHVATQVSCQHSGVVPACVLQGKQVHTSGDYYYLIYPYIDGVVYSHDSIPMQCVMKIGHWLGALHRDPVVLTEDAPEDVALSLDALFSIPYLCERRHRIVSWYHRGEAAVAQLDVCWLLSHRDLNPRNVIWSDDQLHVIDWEWAGKIHRDVDALHTALMWSGIMEHAFDSSRFNCFWQGYHDTGMRVTHDVVLLLHALYQPWLAWLYLNAQQGFWSECESAMRTLQFIDELTISNPNI